MWPACSVSGAEGGAAPPWRALRWRRRGDRVTASERSVEPLPESAEADQGGCGGPVRQGRRVAATLDRRQHVPARWAGVH
jgi:hypothetical protein